MSQTDSCKTPTSTTQDNNTTTNPNIDNKNNDNNNTDNNNSNESNIVNNNNNNIANTSSIEEFLKKTGFQLLQENGQRRLSKMECCDSAVPGKGCEVFVGKLPRDCFEDELVPVMQKAGEVFECRIMVDFDKKNRGFGFVTFCSRDEARQAVKKLDNFEIRPKRYLGLCHSVDNCRLFVGGIPLEKKQEDVTEAMKQVCEGVVTAIVYSTASDKNKNRGFAFVEFQDHNMAAHARRKLMKGSFRLWGVVVAVDWAEPEIQVDEEVMEKVKILYVRNLMSVTSEETILKTVLAVLGGEEKKEGKGGGQRVEKVKKLKDFAFVHFKERDDALEVMKALDNTTLDRSVIEVTLAKPSNKDHNHNNHNNHNNHHNPMILKTSKLSISPAHHYSLPQFFPPQNVFPLGNQLINHSNFHNSFQTARKAGGISRSYGNKQSQQQPHHYHHGGVKLVPVSTLKSLTSAKSPVHLLEEISRKYGMSMPVYQLHQVQSNSAPSDQPLFVYKLYMPSLSTEAYVCKKLSKSVDEAMKLAAENVLVCMGYVATSVVG